MYFFKLLKIVCLTRIKNKEFETVYFIKGKIINLKSSIFFSIFKFFSIVMTLKQLPKFLRKLYWLLDVTHDLLRIMSTKISLVGTILDTIS
jgi:hypothetical protein